MSFFKTVFKKVFTIPSKTKEIPRKVDLEELFQNVTLMGSISSFERDAVSRAVERTNRSYKNCNLILHPMMGEIRSQVITREFPSDEFSVHVGWGPTCNTNDIEFIVTHELKHVHQLENAELSYKFFPTGAVPVFKGQIVNNKCELDTDHYKMPQEIDANQYAISLCGSTGYASDIINSIVTITLELSKEAA